MANPPHSARVVVPYVPGMLRAQTMNALNRERPDWYSAPLDRSKPLGYARLLIELWETPQDLVIVEQDVVPPDGAIQGLLDCDRPWCTHPMESGGGIRDDLLGLVRFADWLILLRPNLMREALLKGMGGNDWPSWTKIDRRLSHWLRAHHMKPHVHQPEAVHLKYAVPPSDDGVPATLLGGRDPSTTGELSAEEQDQTADPAQDRAAALGPDL